MAEALDVAPDATIVEAANVLGGSGVTAPDTVPLCLWRVAHACAGFQEALWHTVSALGDRDTTCAIVGGIFALRTGHNAFPGSWLEAREKLPLSAVVRCSGNRALVIGELQIPGGVIRLATVIALKRSFQAS